MLYTRSLKRPALLSAALLGLFLLPSPALAVPPWSQRDGALCSLCPCNGMIASASAPLELTDAPLIDSFFKLGPVEKSPWGFASRASETGLTGGRAVTEDERRHRYGIYSNSVLIGFRWGF